MYRLIIFIFTLLTLVHNGLHAQSEETISLSDDTFSYQNINNYVEILNDIDPTLIIDSILADGNKGFMSHSDYVKTGSLPATIWARIQIDNTTNRERKIILSSSNCIERFMVFSVVDDVVHKFKETGYGVPTSEKEIPSSYTLVPITIDANSTFDYYIRIHLPQKGVLSECINFYLKEDLGSAYRIAINQAGQALYAGIMIMFSLLSFFAFFMFKDKGFSYFGVVHLAFVFYFLETNGSIILMMFDITNIGGYRLQNFAVSFLVLSLAIFVGTYLKLEERDKRLYLFYLVVSIVASICSYPIYYFTKSIYLSGVISNLVIIFWTLVALALILKYTIQGDKSAKNLLIAVGLFAIAAVVQIFTLLDVIAQNIVSNNIFQISSIFFSLFIFYRLFEIVRNIDDEKREAVSVNKLKSKLFTNISHEFRTPLTLIMGPLQQLIDKSNEDGDVKLMEGALQNSFRLLNMVNQLLDLSKIENNHVKLDVEENEFIAFSKGIFMSFESLADSKGLQMKFESEVEQLQLWYDVEKMEIIFFNLLSNAFKFTPKGGSISLKISEGVDEIIIDIQDSGIGISKENLPYVFDRFFRVENSADSSVDGSGIGLSLSKELVALHCGSVSVHSTVGVGTTFTLRFKKGKTHFDQTQVQNTIGKEMSSFVDMDLLNGLVIENQPQGTKGKDPSPTKPTILLVEDNRDVRNYIKSILEKQFDIFDAENGEVGYEMAKIKMPELVISDVMMPVMNGFDLCEKIKSDVNTSHIPVILLTAKVENEDRLRGLELGADEYLLKPFHAKELNIRVKKLIELRIKLRDKLLKSPLVKITPLDGNPVENQFIEQIGDLIGKHIANPIFNVDMLANEIGLSRSQLNRKIKSIVDMTTNKYIQYIRLQKALVLLEEEDKNVSEVAFLVGFSSIAYFVKCFKDQFGKTPGSFQKS